MATLQQVLVYDTSTLANFTATFKTGFSDVFNTAGWRQTNDSGQIVWTATVLTLTQVSVSGSVATYSYSSYTGPAPRVGMSVTITGFATGANNVTATLTAVSGGSSGTFNVTKVSQANETHAGSATTTAISALPGTDATTYYEIFQTPADGLTSYYVKFAYSNTGSRGPELYAWIATGTDGAGNLTGFVSAQFKSSTSNWSGGGATTYNYYACYDGSSIAILMARDSTVPKFLSLERSRDSNGNYTSSYLTMFGHFDNGVGVGNKFQQSLISGFGAVPAAGAYNEFCVISQRGISTASANSYIGIFPVFPCVPYADFPSLMVGQVQSADFGEGVTLTDTYYGATHTFLTFGNGNAGNGLGAATGVKQCMRYE
jgi:hypothetical protein